MRLIASSEGTVCFQPRLFNFLIESTTSGLSPIHPLDPPEYFRLTLALSSFISSMTSSATLSTIVCSSNPMLKMLTLAEDFCVTGHYSIYAVFNMVVFFALFSVAEDFKFFRVLSK